MHIAAGLGRLEMLKVLVAHGANLGVPDHQVGAGLGVRVLIHPHPRGTAPCTGRHARATHQSFDSSWTTASTSTSRTRSVPRSLSACLAMFLSLLFTCSVPSSLFA